MHAEFAMGFTAGDTPHTGPSVIVYANTMQQANVQADRLTNLILAAENTFDSKLLAPEEAVRSAANNSKGRPVILADVQDNAGAGATSDTTGLLKAMISEKAQRALLGLMCDPHMAAKAVEAGKGETITGALGGHAAISGDTPYFGKFMVEEIGPGECAYSGEMYGGSIAVLGNTAMLRVLETDADIHVVITEKRSQCLDKALFTHLGINLMNYRMIGVKSTVHFRADFDSIATETISVAAPGAFPCELSQVPYQNLKEGIRIEPNGRVFRRY